MARKQTFYPLYTEQDEQYVRPVLGALRAQGMRVADANTAPHKSDIVLLFLSQNLSENADVAVTFFQLDAKGFEIVPINLDGTKPPELIENALYSRNTVFAERYSAEELALRLLPPNRKQTKRTALIAAGAAVLLIAAAIVLIIKLRPAKETAVAEEPTPAPTAVPTEEPIPPIPEMPGVDPLSVAEVVYVGGEFRYFTWDEGYSQDDGTGDMQGESAIAHGTWEDDSAHFYSKEDGHEIPFAEIDVSYLHYLKNLKHLTLANVKCELPDLSALSALRCVTLSHCDIPDLNGLRDSGIQSLEYHGNAISDFSPLSGCPALTIAQLDIVGTETADFSGFYPPKLSDLYIGSALQLVSPDFSWLSQCTSLTRLRLSYVPQLNDLSCISGCAALERLGIQNMNLIRLDGIETLKNLKILSLIDVSQLRDISAIEGCTALEVFQMAGYPENVSVSDLSALGTLPNLYYLSNLATLNTDLDYLKALPTKQGITLILASDGIRDYSGLAAIESYSYIYMNLMGDGGRLTDAAPALEYLKEPAIKELYLRNARNVDLSAVSHVETGLCLETCDVSDLKGLSDDAAFSELMLDDCPYLTSLAGIETIDGFGWKETGTSGGQLIVEDCLHLYDWSALAGAQLEVLSLIRLNTLPDFSTFTAETILLEDFPELRNLNCLAELDPDFTYSIYLIDLPNLTDISTLYRLKGNELMIGPEWKEQAEELVSTGVFQSYEIVYPDGSWQPNDSDFSLLSLDELSALPKSVLKRVSSLRMAGDTLLSDDAYEIEYDWSTDPATLYLYDPSTEDAARIPVETGTCLTDLSVLKDLVGLRLLDLAMQPFETLEDIQYLDSLETLRITFCPNLTDASAAFALQGLTELDLKYTGITSIQGVQNLTQLQSLNLCGTNVTDLSPVLNLMNLQTLTVSADMEAAIASLSEPYSFTLNIE